MSGNAGVKRHMSSEAGSDDESRAFKRRAEKERMRVARACDRCKLKKIKCDGLRPCLVCQKKKIPCYYTDSGVPDGSQLAPRRLETADFLGISSSQLASAGGDGSSSNNNKLVLRLLERIEALERRVRDQRPESSAVSARSHSPEAVDSLSGSGSGSGSGPGPGPGSGSGSGSGAGAGAVATAGGGGSAGGSCCGPENGTTQGHEPTVECRPPPDADDPILELRKFAVMWKSDKKFRYTRRYLSLLPSVFGSIMYRSLRPDMRSQVNVPRLQYYGWNMSGMHFVPMRGLKIPRVDGFDDELGHSLLQYFFDKVNPLYAILHQSVFMSQFEKYRAAEEKGDTLLWISLYYLACALAMRFSEIAQRRVYPPGLEERLFDEAHHILETFTFQWESIEIVQGWLLVTMYLRACHRQSSTWAALGKAIRLAQGIGLNNRCWLMERSKYECQKMIRVFWCVYTWDRLLCIDMGRTFTMRDDEIQLPKPTEYYDDGWLTPSAYALLRLACSLGPFEEDRGNAMSPIAMECAYEALLDWNNSVARPLGFGQDKAFIHVRPELDPALYCHIRLQYYECILQVYGRAVFAMLDPTLDFDNPPGSHSVLLAASKSIITCLQELASLGVLENGWWLKLQCLQNAVMILLVFLNAGYEQHSLSSYLSIANEMLDKLTQDGRFGMAEECRWSVRMINSMVNLRLKSAEFITGTAVSPDEGSSSADANEAHFGNVGPLDKSGNIIPAHYKSDSRPSEANGNMASVPPVGGPTPQPVPMPLGQYGSPQIPFPTLNQDLFSPDMIMKLESSLDWFTQ